MSDWLFEIVDLLGNPAREYPSPTLKEIRRAESLLGAKLPRSYLEFLKKGVDPGISSHEMYRIGRGIRKSLNIAEANRSEREDVEPALPDFLVTFLNDGGGNQYCFDTRRPTRNGDCPIVFFSHECSTETNLKRNVVVGASFREWLLDEVRSRRKPSD